VTVVLLVTFLAMSRSLLGSMELSRTNRESALAQDGLRQGLELLQGSGDFASVYRRFNADPADDPATGPVPGSGFAVPGLQPDPADPDGLVGEIVFPTVAGAGVLELREDVNFPELGMPRDLNGDGVTDSVDHAADYRILPVVVRLRWQGSNGLRTAEIRTILADR
jgi:hypothetical protein